MSLSFENTMGSASVDDDESILSAVNELSIAFWLESLTEPWESDIGEEELFNLMLVLFC